MAEAEEIAAPAADSEETEAERHRRERRELQATIQQMKKSVNKNDKTRKKKLDADIRALEEAFEKKWANFDENAPTATQVETKETAEVRSFGRERNGVSIFVFGFSPQKKRTSHEKHGV